MSKRRRSRLQFDDGDDLLDGDAAVLDLHGRTAQEARRLVRDFIATRARSVRGGLVHIITGKGRHSPNGSVLQPAVKTELAGACASFIAVCSPDIDEGGFRVRLR